MADYDNDPTRPITRRLRYFDNQLLRDQDFIDEQKYHIDRLRRASRAHLSPGRVEGLDVTLDDPQDPGTVRVSPGTAVDGHGRWLVLARPSARANNDGSVACVGIKWRRGHATEPEYVQEQNSTRFDETPEVWTYADLGALEQDGAVALATLEQSNGYWTVTPAPPAGLRLPGLSDRDPPAIVRVGADGLSFTTDRQRPLTIGSRHVEVGTGDNPLRFTSAWSGFANEADQPDNHAEIANDTRDHKALMIVGNRSSGRRTVKLFDDLVVNAGASVGGALKVGAGEAVLCLTANWSGFAGADQPDHRAELANDTDSHKALVIAGNRSSGRRTVKIFDDLAVEADASVGGALEVDAGTNPLRLTANWSGFADVGQPDNHAEIANDTTSYKALMIVGNRSSGRRTVQLFDDVTISTSLTVGAVRSGGPYVDFTVLHFHPGSANPQQFQVAEGTVIFAVASLSSFSLEYVDDDHNVKRIHVMPKAEWEKNGSTITVKLDIGMVDGKRSPTSYSATVLVIYKVG